MLCQIKGKTTGTEDYSLCHLYTKYPYQFVIAAVSLDLTQHCLSLIFTCHPNGLRRAETFRSACIPAENEEQMWTKTNETEAESMWFRSLSAVFSQADPLGRSLLIPFSQ